MKIELHGIPEFYWSPSDAHLAVLAKLSALHYDGTCKAAAGVADNQGRRNGFITIWKLSLEYAEPGESRAVRATNQDLQICLKLMELPRMILNQHERVLVREMQDAFWAALRLSNEKYAEWKAST